ncbi:PorH family porin [Corynebacterium aquilae]|nr:PorH family porin [Corynebacterium aquilae]
MDLSVVKTVLGDFSTFTDALGTLVEKFPKMVEVLVKLTQAHSS